MYTTLWRQIKEVKDKDEIRKIIWIKTQVIVFANY